MENEEYNDFKGCLTGIALILVAINFIVFIIWQLGKAGII